MKHDRERLLVGGALELLAYDRDVTTVGEVTRPLPGTKRQEVAVRSLVVKGAEVFRIVGHGPTGGNCRAA